ncbi:hypothetical protein [Candidatus Halobonum tyrrellensis]|uniref:Uncharacterized protein n=1 Tax=Candidatus Halobonum tyrrellensis G22 TaxID=1324957 RepID=V4HP30_9EURY|nr:hypothetical protein [Candidatus Halobonum tyrrellensis]ESP89674.1 hypothetical protein K933_02751 [Candidatus Halobonum tyrrellensis G22]
MSDDRGIGRISTRTGLFVVSTVLLSTVVFAVFAELALFRDSAIPVLFELAGVLPFGLLFYLALSYVLGITVCYAFVYRGGVGWVRSRVDR